MGFQTIRDEAINVLKQGPVPQHIAFIMDGNRRYAKMHGVPLVKGHYLGAEALSDVIKACFLCGVKGVTVYALSLENLKRSKEQVNQLMDLFKFQITELCKPGGLAERFQSSFRILGQLDKVDDDLRARFVEAMENSRYRKERFVNICIAYTSRDEIIRAMRTTVGLSRNMLSSSHITDHFLTMQMYTADDPAVDLLVRTSGVRRLSDFLLWQCHEDTDIQIVDSLWPEFGISDLFMVILRWQRKKARDARPKMEKTTSVDTEKRSTEFTTL
ncbi:Decaprenyl diphosphate synthase-like protein [Aspergillus bertholletiae]|uniref:Alkyl transferase n=1 Tax=Aspergillus bertholletiae TaxID=1226010 RepID=A0A5N7B967_9EURO|nr:Decaprenyl diphosphate synthase-like protein [Aspergillus bertholletiae]